VSKVWLSSPHLGEREIEYVNEAFATNWIAPLGPNVDAFENQISSYLNVKEAVSLSSGTAALHLALVACGVNQEDIVLCQSFTFAASAFPIQYLGAHPVFIDSEKETWNMDPLLLEESITDYIKIGKKPAAVIVVHLYGMPAKMNEIVAICAKYDIPIIEDAAEALGSVYEEKKCGSIGKIGILSFNGNKIITTSGGGALVSNHSEIIIKVRHISAQAKEPAAYYLHKEIGYNYRMSNVCAGIGRGQMEVLNDRVQKRREIFEVYQKELKDINGLYFLDEPNASFSNRWLTTVVFDPTVFKKETNEKIRKGLESVNIETRPLWKPLHQQPVFKSCKAYINGVSDYLFENGLCLPSGSNMNDEVIAKVIKEIRIQLLND
jgi:dTDP-4-amino-4,6-dideoxygalactose transaminase